MGSVQDMIECPQCGGIYHTDYYYRTGEEYRYCFRCGRTEQWTLVRDKERKPILDKEGKFTMDYKLQEDFGSARIELKNGVGQLHTFSEAVNQNIKDAYLKAIENPDVNKEHCYLSSWDQEKKEVVMIFGSMPETYDEFMSSISEKEEDSAVE